MTVPKQEKNHTKVCDGTRGSTGERIEHPCFIDRQQTYQGIRAP